MLKAFAARPMDWRDVESIVQRQGVWALNWHYVRRQLAPLVEAKEDPEIPRHLERIIHRAER